MPDHPTDLAVGDPSGHGTYGQVTVSCDDEYVLCHECGRWKRIVGTHTWYAHGLTAVEYRRRHGLSTGQSLAAPVTRARYAAMPQLQPGGAALRALEEHRDPARARAANTAEGRARPQRRAVRAATAAKARRGRHLVAAEVESLRAAASIGEWVRVARGLVADGVRQAEIGRAVGMPAVTVSQRMRRY